MLLVFLLRIDGNFKRLFFFLATLHDYVGDHDDNDYGGGDYDNYGDEAEGDEYR